MAFPNNNEKRENEREREKREMRKLGFYFFAFEKRNGYSMNFAKINILNV